MIVLIQLGVLLLHDLPHPRQGQILWHQFLTIKEAPLHGWLVLDEGRDHLVQVLAANPRRFLALRLYQSLDLDLESPCVLVEAHVALLRIISIVAVVKPRLCRAGLRLGLEFELRRQDLFHQKAGRDRLQRVVDCLGHQPLRGVRFRDQVRKSCVGFTRRIAGCAADDLHHLCKAGAVSHGQGVFAPNPVEPFLRHAQRDDDVHMVAVHL